MTIKGFGRGAGFRRPQPPPPPRRILQRPPGRPHARQEFPSSRTGLLLIACFPHPAAYANNTLQLYRTILWRTNTLEIDSTVPVPDFSRVEPRHWAVRCEYWNNVKHSPTCPRVSRTNRKHIPRRMARERYVNYVIYTPRKTVDNDNNGQGLHEIHEGRKQ